MEYNFKEIEARWRKEWKEKDVYKTSGPGTPDAQKPKYYVLDMFPYPSGAGLHVGHPLGYIASDIFARYKRLKGFNVLHPMGYDAFGLPAEQYAIETGQHPAVTTMKNIARYREQLDKIGFSFDWSREVRTSDPAFYKWTQWIFLKLFNSWYNPDTAQAEATDALIAVFEKRGFSGNDALEQFTKEEWLNFSEDEKSDILMHFRLAYLSEAWVNWCPKLGTVLANDEVKDGVSERGGYPVERKLMPQWSLRITAYADRLLNDLDALDWPENIKEAQRNWIGKSEGCSLQFRIASLEGAGASIVVFTTRPDTIFGVSFITLAPENELVSRITAPEQKQQVEAYINSVKNKSDRERQAEVKNVSGVFTGAYAIHPFTGKQIPVWLGDYVLSGYGTGAVMGVPAHDSRDFAFAKHFGLEIIPVIQAPAPPKGVSSEGAVKSSQSMHKENSVMKADNSETNTNFEKSNTKHEIQHILSGKSEARNGTAIEAAAGYLRKSKGSISMAEGTKPYKEEETKNLKKYIADNNLWLSKESGDYIGEGAEQKVYLIGNYYIKLNDSIFYSSWEDYFNSLLLHNYFFPDTAYTLTGFIEKNNVLYAVVKQPFVEATEITDLELVKKFMASNGFINTKNNDYYNQELGLILEDLHDENVLTKDGVLYFIDTVFYIQSGTTEKEPAESYDAKEGKCINSGFLNGLEVKEAMRRAIEEIEKKGIGTRKVNYRLRDAAFGRQRYWGEPIPVYYKVKAENEAEVKIPAAIDENKLPLLLPEIDNFKPTETGDPPLARAVNWKYEGRFEYEHTTMPGWAGSSWYYLRYMDPHNDNEFASREAINYWQNVDLYVGGAEHVTGHLLYVRFWTKFLYDLGYLPFIEPAKKLVNQGMILGESWFAYYDRANDEFCSADQLSGTQRGMALNFEDTYNAQERIDIKYIKEGKLLIDSFKNGRPEFHNSKFRTSAADGNFYCIGEVEKMSKSKYNVVNPDEVIEQYGADTLRLYEMFLGPIELSKPWSTQGISGVHNFLKKLWRTVVSGQSPADNKKDAKIQLPDEEPTPAELKILHKTIKKVNEDIERLNLNTSVSAFMICLNELSELKCKKKAIYEPLLICLSPFAPFIAEELWSRLGHSSSILKERFPEHNEAYLQESTFAYPVSFNGKTRLMLELPLNLTKDQIEKKVLENENVKKWLDGKPVKKVIVVPNKIVNVVI